MRASALAFAAVLLLVLVPAPTARADTATLTVLDETDRPRTDFHRPERLVFEVRVTTTVARALDHQIHVYRGTDTLGSEVAILDDGGTTNTVAGVRATFRIVWDQHVNGVFLGAGQYVAQYRLPDGGRVTARFNLEYAPDHEITAIGELEPMLAGAGTAVAWAQGCVRNIGIRPSPGANVTVLARSLAPSGWHAQATAFVAYGSAPCPHFAPGTYFRIPYTPAATPGGVALREIAVHANAAATEWEPDFDNNLRTRAARWLV